MPSLSPIFQRNLLQLQKFIPRRWKQGTILEFSLQNNNYPSTSSSSSSILEQYILHKSQETLIESSLKKVSPTFGKESLIDFIQSSLKSFASQGQLSEAFEAFSLLQFHSFSTSSYSLLILHSISSLLLSCTTLKSLSQGKQIHARIVTLGLEQHPLLVPKLVTFYSTFGHLISAHVITENSNFGRALPWNVLISAYIRYGYCEEALSAYKQMVSMGVKPDNFTYPSVLKACGYKFDLDFGREVHKSIDSSCLEWSLFVQNALVSMYAKCGEVNVARSLFEKMPKRDVVSWNSIISGYASKGMWEHALELFDRMRLGNTQMNIVTWNTIAGGCLQTGNYVGALELISQMRNHVTCLDSVAIVIGLGACSRIGFAILGKEMHGYAVRSSLDRVENVKNVLITMYSRCKDLIHAYMLFQSTEAKSLITWNSMIAGYTHLNRFEEASILFREMVSTGLEPNYVSITCILPLCARVANLQHGKELHCYILRHKVFKDLLLPWNSLVDMYAKSGKILEAKRVFDSMTEKDEVTYTSLISGYGMQREGQAALKLFEEMNMRGFKPDHITMVAVLAACCHSGLVSQGQFLFEKMVSFYKVNPRMEHFACMVDLFGRAGLLRRAVQIITEMPFQPSPAIWATLIGACQVHGNINMREWAPEILKLRSCWR